MMRTDNEILAEMARIEGTDFFGFVTGDLLAYLPFEAAKPFLKDGVTADQWSPTLRDHDSLVNAMREYMPFAWEKANDCRGLSAGRSLNHMQAWLWMLGEDKAAGSLDDYSLYGKPQLRAICEHYGIDWRSMDSGRWQRSDSDDGVPAPDETITLPFNTDFTGLDAALDELRKPVDEVRE